jgi:biotin synthase
METLFLKRLKNALKNKSEIDKDLLLSFLNLSEGIELGKAFDILKQHFTQRRNVIKIIPQLNFTNYCLKHCLFCHLRCYNKELKRFRLKPEDIVFICWHLINVGFRTLLLQGGDDKYFFFAQLMQVIENLNKQADLNMILAAGEFSYDQFAALKRAGLDSYMLSESIADPDLYRRYHPYSSYLHRIRAMEWIHSVGLEVSITNRIGLPYQSIQTLFEDAMFFNQLGVYLIALEPFIPCKGTPLEDEPPVSFSLMLKMIVICRLFNPQSLIAVSTEIEDLKYANIEECFSLGANTLFFPLDRYIDLDKENDMLDKNSLKKALHDYNARIESIDAL